MTATESRLHITVSREFLALLKKAKAGRIAPQPRRDRRAGADSWRCEALVEKQAKRKACVPAKVKREVVKRDGGKCQWKLADGGVCGATARLEVDHVVPRGKGGPDTIDNCRILCKSHNLEAARRAYGDEVMDLFTRGGGRSGGSEGGEEWRGTAGRHGRDEASLPGRSRAGRVFGPRIAARTAGVVLEGFSGMRAMIPFVQGEGRSIDGSRSGSTT